VINLGIGNILCLRNLQPRKNKSNDAEPHKDKPNLATQVSLICVEHVRNAQGEGPSHECIDQKAEPEGFGAQSRRWDLGCGDWVGGSNAEVVTAGGKDEGDADESEKLG
jgi:hypothetical protein